MDKMFDGFGDLVFSLFVGYIGALEFLLMVRHLYHRIGQHPTEDEDVENLKRIKEKLRQELAKATEQENQVGKRNSNKIMQDGIQYKDGFRVDSQEKDIERLSQEAKVKEAEEKEKAKLEAETEAEAIRQKAIEEENRKKSEEAEAALERQRKEQAASEEAENFRRLLEVEKKREEDQRKLEEEAREKEKKSLEQKEKEEEKENMLREEKRLSEEAENLRKILEIERQKEAEQQMLIIQRQKQQRTPVNEEVDEGKVIKQKSIEENARKFLEAEQEMIAIQDKMLTMNESPSPIVEELIVKSTYKPLEAARPANDSLNQTIKTQIGQGSNESITVITKSAISSNLADEGSSNERREPEGEDTSSAIHYTDDYLRSLDGINKFRPLIREDGSGRRRAFKKRRSSGSSNSSRESRASREEEVKMFTSLEEEELERNKDRRAIQNSQDQTLKPKSSHYRRLKRSPANLGEENLRSSLELLGEDSTNPWGEVVPEHYKNTEFWRREKAMSIDEEEIELDLPHTSDSNEGDDENDSNSNSNSNNNHNDEVDNDERGTEAGTTKDSCLGKAMHGEDESNPIPTSDAGVVKTISDNQIPSEKEFNHEASNETACRSSPAHSSLSPRLRRSPRIEVIDQYEERWKETEEAPAEKQSQVTSTTPATPSIEVQKSEDVSPWRDEYGLVMQGLSDFYDFQASVNPSRSRSTSRNPSPPSSQPSSPQPKNISYDFPQNSDDPPLTQLEFSDSNSSVAFDVYDDTGNVDSYKISQGNITALITKTQGEKTSVEDSKNDNFESLNLEGPCIPSIEIRDDDEVEVAQDQNQAEMNSLIQSLRADRGRSRSRSQQRSRSRSPLPTSENLERSLESRKLMLIKHNEEILEKFIKEPAVPIITAQKKEIESKPQDEEKFVENDREKSESRSPSPLPTCENLERSLESRKLKKDESTISQEANAEIELQDDKKTNENAQDQEEMNALVKSLRADRVRSKSRSQQRSFVNLDISLESPRTNLIDHNEESVEKFTKTPLIPIKITHDDEADLGPSDKSIENVPIGEMSKLIDCLQVNRRRSRSRSPLPNSDNIQRSLEARRHKLIEHNNEILQKIALKGEKEKIQLPIINIEGTCESNEDHSPGESREEMSALVASLRAARSRSRSPMPRGRSKSPQSPRVAIEYEVDSQKQEKDDERGDKLRHHERSRTPSRSQSPQVIQNYPPEDSDFNRMLNLESSQNRTLLKNTEEMESILAEKQRHIDQEALYKLKTAKEEMELPTVMAASIFREEMEEHEHKDHFEEDNDRLLDLRTTERLQILRCSPTTPDYNRTISEEWRDVQRIKNEMLTSGFKRSTYVGESTDFGKEFEELRQSAQAFRRSNSPSRSIPGSSDMESLIPSSAVEKRRIQEDILKELIASSAANQPGTPEEQLENRLGAKPKTDRRLSDDQFRTISKEIEDTQRIKDDLLNSGFKRSTYVGESVELSPIVRTAGEHDNEYEILRREMAEFRRSRSCSRSRSRSPVGERRAAAVNFVEMETAQQEMQDRVLDSMRFEEISRNLNADFLDDRRASDSALIRKGDGEIDDYMEPEEYHHYRRFSLHQEEPMEEYPDDDYVYISQIEVRTATGTRTWTREDYYSENLDTLKKELEQDERLAVGEIFNEDEETDGSEDERRTVVEVEDEIDTDICDYNERGPTDESHHEQSECEEADRAIDHYANRAATDWETVSNENARRDLDEEGAVGGMDFERDVDINMDTDSYTIDEIYDEAIRNRKQSGIMREYDSILQEMQKSFESRVEDLSDRERYELWAKTRALERGRNSSTVSFSELENREMEIRYLGDANISARQSTRLRSRYGYVPLLQSNSGDDIEVDLNYKPKKEYNWRKNFKLDDENESKGDKESPESDQEMKDFDCKDSNSKYHNNSNDEANNEGDDECYDDRKFSLGGESITLFSRSPEREMLPQLNEEANENGIPLETHPPNAQLDAVAPLSAEKPKKKKSKKKKESSKRRLSKDEDDSDRETLCSPCQRRSSSLQIETIDSPKKKSRSRRSSKSSINNEEPPSAFFSQGNSIGGADLTPTGNGLAFNAGNDASEREGKKKIKKRKKVKETFATAQHHIKEEQESMMNMEIASANNLATASTNLTPETASLNMLATLSPQNSVCVTPASTSNDSEKSLRRLERRERKLRVSTKSSETGPDLKSETNPPSSNVVDNFDILKDANFYPLF